MDADLLAEIRQAKQVVKSLRNHTQGVVQILAALEERLEALDPTTREVQGQRNGYKAEVRV